MNNRWRWTTYQLWYAIKNQQGLRPDLINECFLDFQNLPSIKYKSKLISLTLIESEYRRFYKRINDSCYQQGYTPGYVYRKNSSLFQYIIEYCKNSNTTYGIDFQIETKKDWKQNKLLARQNFLSNNSDMFYPQFEMCREGVLHYFLYYLDNMLFLKYDNSIYNVTADDIQGWINDFIKFVNNQIDLTKKSAMYKFSFFTNLTFNYFYCDKNSEFEINNLTNLPFYKQLNDIAYLNSSNPVYYYKNFDNYIKVLEDYCNGSPKYNAIWNNYEKF